MERIDNQGSSRRKSARVNIRIKGNYRKVSPNTSEDVITFETESIGTGGLMFYSEMPCLPDDKLEIHIFIGNNTIEAAAKVAKVEPVKEAMEAKGIYSIRLKFTKVTPIDQLKIDNYIFQIIAKNRIKNSL